MRVMKRLGAQRGKLTVKAMLALVVFAVVVLVGGTLLNKLSPGSGKQPQTAVQQSATALESKYDSWTTFSNKYLTFKYPSTWYVAACTDTTWAGCVMLVGPVENTITIVNPNTDNPGVYKNPHLALVMAPTYPLNNGSRDCAANSGITDGCDIYDVEKLSSSGLPGANLVMSDYGATGHPVIMTVTDSNSLTAGNSNYDLGLYVNGKLRYITATVAYGGTATVNHAYIYDKSQVVGTTSYENLRDIISTLAFKKG